MRSERETNPSGCESTAPRPRPWGAALRPRKPRMRGHTGVCSELRETVGWRDAACEPAKPAGVLCWPRPCCASSFLPCRAALPGSREPEQPRRWTPFLSLGLGTSATALECTIRSPCTVTVGGAAAEMRAEA